MLARRYVLASSQHLPHRHGLRYLSIDNSNSSSSSAPASSSVFRSNQSNANTNTNTNANVNTNANQKSKHQNQPNQQKKPYQQNRNNNQQPKNPSQSSQRNQSPRSSSSPPSSTPSTSTFTSTSNPQPSLASALRRNEQNHKQQQQRAAQQQQQQQEKEKSQAADATSSTSASTLSSSSTPTTSPATPVDAYDPTLPHEVPQPYSGAGRVVQSRLSPPPKAPLTQAELRARRIGFVATVKKLYWEFYWSAYGKLSNPIATVRDIANGFRDGPVISPGSLAIKHQWRRFFENFGVSFKPAPPLRHAIAFAADTDLSKFSLLNDNPFGGTTSCSMEVREHVEEDGTKRYTLVFKGVLQNMNQFQTSASRWMDDTGKPAIAAVPKKDPNATPVPQAKQDQMLSKPPSMNASASTPLPPASAPSLSSPASKLWNSLSGKAPAPATPSFAPTQKPSGQIHGFAAFITPQYEYPDLDLERYDYLSLNLRTDGRPYLFNVRAREGPVEMGGFVYQARVREEEPRPMHRLEIRFESFLPTQNGRTRSIYQPLPRDRIESFGFSVSGPPGPFELELESINAHTGVPQLEVKAKQNAILARLESVEEVQNKVQRIEQLDKRQLVAQELEKLRKAKGVATKSDDTSIMSLFQDTRPNSTGPAIAAEDPNSRSAPSEESNEDLFASRRQLEDVTTFPAEVQNSLQREREEYAKKLRAQIEEETRQLQQEVQKERKLGQLTPLQVREILARVGEGKEVNEEGVKKDKQK